jgi:hypothetical protein
MLLTCSVCRQTGVRAVYKNGDQKQGLVVGAHDEKLREGENHAVKPFQCLGVGEPGLSELEATRE